jgi:hypothetical protein
MISSILYVQVFRWRTAASMFWLVLVTIPVLLVFRVLSSCSLLHPFTWITGRIATYTLISLTFKINVDPCSKKPGMLYIKGLIYIQCRLYEWSPHLDYCPLPLSLLTPDGCHLPNLFCYLHRSVATRNVTDKIILIVNVYAYSS